MKPKSRMYEVEGKRVRTWNPFAGCNFNCSYCYSPKLYKRFSKCEDCQKFVPHFHPERLNQKFSAGETVFVCSMGDISFASFDQFADILVVIGNHPETTFYIQSKNPAYFAEYSDFIGWNPDLWGTNVVLGATIETNFLNLYLTERISKAPHPLDRMTAMVKLDHPRKYVTIEPVLEFNIPDMIEWMKEIAPEFAYVGYLNPKWKAKKLRLPEPLLKNTKELCKELAKFTEVRLKTIRKGWDEE